MNERIDSTGLNDCLDLIPDRSLVAHCIIGVLFQTAARRFSRLRAYARTVELRVRQARRRAEELVVNARLHAAIPPPIRKGGSGSSPANGL